MVIWTLVIGISLLVNGKIDMGAQVEAVFRTEAECKKVKAVMDASSAQAAREGTINPTVNSFGTVCVPVILDIHSKAKTTGA